MNKWIDEKQYLPPVYSWRKPLVSLSDFFISGNLFECTFRSNSMLLGTENEQFIYGTKASHVAYFGQVKRSFWRYIELSSRDERSPS